jgi:hypothetical protein
MTRPSPLVPALSLLLAPACGGDEPTTASEGNTSTTASSATELPDSDYTFQGAAMDTAYGIDIADLGADPALDIVRLAGFGPEFALEVWLR